jgi:hypothetical protein
LTLANLLRMGDRSLRLRSAIDGEPRAISATDEILRPMVPNLTMPVGETWVA